MNKKNAILDIGNSLIKLGIADHEKNGLQTVFECDSFKDCCMHLSAHRVELLLYSNVRPKFNDSELTSPQMTRIINVQDLSLGDSIRFNERLDMGIDRKLACLAAVEKAVQPFIVVTLGTATTISLVNNNNCDYSIIWPGLQLSTRSISDNTRINVVSDPTASSCENLFSNPNSLENCVNQGVYFSTVLAIESWIKKYEDDSGKSLDVLLTGGNANAVSGRLGPSHFVEPNLVLRGLLTALQYVL